MLATVLPVSFMYSKYRGLPRIRARKTGLVSSHMAKWTAVLGNNSANVRHT
jgi:hypothetical protein